MGEDCEVGYVCRRGNCILSEHCFSDIDCSSGFECKASYCRIKNARQEKINHDSSPAKILIEPTNDKTKFLKPSNKVFLKACGCYKSIEGNTPDPQMTDSKVTLNQITTNSSFCSEVLDVFINILHVNICYIFKL